MKSRPTELGDSHHYNSTTSDRNDAWDKFFASTRWPAENANRFFVIFLTGSNSKKA